MIKTSPPQWARTTTTNGPYSLSRVPDRLSPSQALVRHGVWIFLFVIVTVWELLGFIFPVLDAVPRWWDHPTISQEMKAIIGTSLFGRVVSSCLIIFAAVVLVAHWSWRAF